MNSTCHFKQEHPENIEKLTQYPKVFIAFNNLHINNKIMVTLMSARGLNLSSISFCSVEKIQEKGKGLPSWASG